MRTGRRGLLHLSPLLLAAGAGAEAIPRPVGATGRFDLVRNWDFGIAPGCTVRDMAALGREFHFRYIYEGGRLDGLPQNYWSRHRDYPDGDPRALHVFETDCLVLKARIPPGGGLRQDGIESGILRGRLPITTGMYVEMRAWLPRGVGTWPAFWLNPGVQHADGSFSELRWPPEIDIFEFFNWAGRHRTRVMSTGVQTDGRDAEFGPPHDIFTLFRRNDYVPGVDFSAGWNVFALDWLPDRPSWMLNGRMIRQMHYLWRAPPAHVLVTNQIGMNFPGVDLTGMGAPDDDWDYRVDYLRVWRRSPDTHGHAARGAAARGSSAT